MKSDRRVFKCLFLVVLLIHFILRYPYSESQTDLDGMQLTKYSMQGIRIGQFPNWFSPLSLAGLYPFSYPTASSTFISVLGITTDISINTISLIFSYYISVVGILGVFLCLLEFSPSRPLYPLIGMYFYSVSYYCRSILFILH